MFEIIVDDEVTLRILEEKHQKLVYDLLQANREFVGKWEAWVDGNTLKGQLDYIKQMLENYRRGLGFALGLWYGTDCDYEKILVGSLTYRVAVSSKSAEIGYWLDQQHTGCGLATRATRAVVDYAFNKAHLNRILIVSAVENEKSRAVAERLGFKLDGILRDDLYLRGHFHDRAVYTMLASDWKAITESARP